MTKDPRVYLAHILERANRIEEYLRDGQAAFKNDPKTQDAVIRNFEVIGEAAKRVPEEYRAAHPSIPWQLMAGFRDVLIHGYEGVDLSRVWTTATRDLPAVRDGVDTPLASLFVHVARVVPPDAQGAARARSATESFLYRRLETVSDTKGRFILNAVMPIAFDGQGKMEVDLLCADARVAVELDGAQHLGDRIAYRRDRRKDQLLQENGYVVLRFLAEDVGKDLDSVLDAILRSLSNRQSSPVADHSLATRGRPR